MNSYPSTGGVARTKKVGDISENFGHALYFSEGLLLPLPHTYFLINFKEISSSILAKVGGGGQLPPYPPWPHHWHQFYLNFSYPGSCNFQSSLGVRNMRSALITFYSDYFAVCPSSFWYQSFVRSFSSLLLMLAS